MNEIVKGSKLKAVNRESGEITFLEVTWVLGQRWWAKKKMQVGAIILMALSR